MNLCSSILEKKALNIQPHSTISPSHKEITEIPVKSNGKVISKETSEKVLSMMESVVAERYW